MSHPDSPSLVWLRRDIRGDISELFAQLVDMTIYTCKSYFLPLDVLDVPFRQYASTTLTPPSEPLFSFWNRYIVEAKRWVEQEIYTKVYVLGVVS